ncbi:MAG: hypothetical protein M3Z24_06645, partial [Chloroflexota bacterium]|nr:hypothetical protein [Chloroflexota bacterium]
AYTAINEKYRKAKAEYIMHRPQMKIEPGFLNRILLFFSLRPVRVIDEEQHEIQGRGKASITSAILAMLTNDRALAIGLLAALLSVCIHNVFDDLYVHSVTNLIALLIAALIRLEGVTAKVGVNGGNFAYKSR